MIFGCLQHSLFIPQLGDYIQTEKVKKDMMEAKCDTVGT